MGAEGLLKKHALLGEAIDVRRCEPMIAVAAHVVSPQRVDAQENDVWFAIATRRHRVFLPTDFKMNGVA
jgi:hypothetical protein